MPNYKTMYFDLAARVADAIELLTRAQQEGETAFVEDGEAPLLFSTGGQEGEEDE